MAKIKYSKELIEEAVKDALSIAQVCRNLGLKPVGGNYKTVTRKMEEFGIDSSHFTGQSWNKGLKHIPETSIFPLEDILKENISYKSDTLRKRLIAEGIKKEECEVCGYKENLELHHINGNHYDNRLENLQILCPNCHAKTDNYKGRNSTKNATPENLAKKQAKNHWCTCKNCNKEFYSDRTDKTRKFCSRECYMEYLKKLQLGEVTETLQEFSNIENAKLLTKETLLEAIQNYSDMTNLGKYFGVSRTTIKKYLEKYGLYEDFKSKYDYHAKAILQLDISNNIIKEWPSITDASDSLNIPSTNISRVCKFKRRSAGGYIWKYK